MGLTWVAAGLAQSPALPQEVPALVEFDLECPQPLVLLVCADLMPLQAIAKIALLVDELADSGQWIAVFCHGLQCARCAGRTWRD